LQDSSPSSFFFASKEFRPGAGSRADSFHAELGAGLSRLCIANRSDSANSTASHRAAYLGTADRSFDCAVSSGHEALATKCSFLVKSALFGNSSSTVRGEITVGRRAAKADASFADRALHLSKNARSQSIPTLFIGNDAVKASHSSSKAGLDGNELFYLQARGLSRPVAAKLAVTGFLCEPLNEANAEWSGRVRALVAKRAALSKNEVLE
jgi:Fe-S cluster assembly protein SufD